MKNLSSQKKVILYLFLTISILLTTGCKAKTFDISSKTKIVTSIYPLYDWTHNLSYADNKTSDNKILSLLIKNGMDIHNYKPSPIEEEQIKNCDMIIYLGGKSDLWIKKILEENPNPNQIIVNLNNCIENNKKDEHFWLSIKNAKTCCEEISKALIKLNPENQEIYQTRLNNYLMKLSILDETYNNELKALPNNKIVLCDNNPFTYLFEDYNIDCASPFSTCSSYNNFKESDYDYLGQKFSETQCKSLFVLQNTDKKIGNTVILKSNNKFADVQILDSMENSTLRDAFNGKTYIKVMENNLNLLKKAY